MANKRLTVIDVNNKVEDLTSKFTEGLLEFKKELENKFSTLPVSPSLEAEKSEFLLKFYAFENYIKTSITDIKVNMEAVKNELTVVKSVQDRLWGRYNGCFLVLHGIQETETNQTELCNKLIKFINEGILGKVNGTEKIVITKESISQCYRMGKKFGDKPRPIAVQFTQRWMRDFIFNSKKVLKGSRTLVVEMLTEDVLKLFRQVRTVDKSAWTYGGSIYVSVNGKKRKIQSMGDVVDNGSLAADGDDIRGDTAVGSKNKLAALDGSS